MRRSKGTARTDHDVVHGVVPLEAVQPGPWIGECNMGANGGRDVVVQWKRGLGCSGVRIPGVATTVESVRGWRQSTQLDVT